MRLSSTIQPKTKSEILIAYSELDIETLLLMSVEYGFLSGVKYAIRNGADSSTHSVICFIQLASLYGHLDIVKFLLQYPLVDPSDDYNETIKWASEQVHKNVVKLLLQDKRVVNSLPIGELEKYKEWI